MASSEREDRLAELFERASELAGAEREAYLVQECHEDEELRGEVRRLCEVGARLQEAVGESHLSGGDGWLPDGSAAPQKPGVSPGTRYCVEGEIARGGLGAILRVSEKVLRRTLAMKVMLGGTRERFVEEAQITGQLDHPGIVPVHELGVDGEGCLYFTMRLVKGQDLSVVYRMIREGRNGWNETRGLGVLLKVCEAVAYAHLKGVIHRDLKPGNVMVGRYGEVYVMDWGVAKIVGRTDTRDLRLRPITSIETDRHDQGSQAQDSPLITMDGLVIGTPAFMPPEQAQGRIGELGPTADVYAIGAMLYELLCRQMPYVEPGARLSARTVLAMVIMGPPRPVHQINPRVPSELVAICEKAMARDKNDRYATTLAMADDLRAFLERRVVNAYETGAAAEFRKWIVRNRGIAASLALALLSLLLGLILTVMLYMHATKANARANQSAHEATESGRLAGDRLDEVLRLADLRTCEVLFLRRDELWPEVPDKTPGMQAWVRDAEALVARLPEHEAVLGRLRANSHPTQQEQWWTGMLSDLVSKLHTLADPDPRIGAIADMKTRLDWANRVEHETIDARIERWNEVIAAIAEDGKYAGLAMTYQLGLMPLGKDPETGLFEFGHPRTGSIPDRADGKLRITTETGLVFVLLPGGTFSMGAQSKDRAAPNYDPLAAAEEGPVHEVTLGPFLISKYEMTQGQWLRASRENPSYYQQPARQGDSALVHPVENVSFEDCERVCAHLGLIVPTEAMWEYACRSGSDSPWSSGEDKRSLEGRCNIADDSLRTRGPLGAPVESWNDGYAAHAPVGSYAPNAFGLHDMTGNVWEWCRDRFGTYDLPVRPGDGLRVVPESGARLVVYRGGGFLNVARDARSTRRLSDVPRYGGNITGVRPCRPVDLE